MNTFPGPLLFVALCGLLIPSGCDPEPEPLPDTPCPLDHTPCRILPFGDSITDGLSVPGSYRVDLFRLARADGHDITFVGSQRNGPASVDGVPFPGNHEGHGGFRISDFSELIPHPALDVTPHIILLMLGTNDLIHEDNVDTAPERLGAILDALRRGAPAARIVVAQLPPMDRGVDDALAAYNAAILEVVAARAADGDMVHADMHTGFPMEELLDGVHPSAAGYRRMAEVWYDAIAPVLP